MFAHTCERDNGLVYESVGTFCWLFIENALKRGNCYDRKNQVEIMFSENEHGKW